MLIVMLRMHRSICLQGGGLLRPSGGDVPNLFKAGRTEIEQAGIGEAQAFLE